MVEWIPTSYLLQGRALQWQPSQRAGPLASWSLQAASCTAGKGWLVDCHILPGCVGVKALPSSKRLQRSLGLPSGAPWRNGNAGHGPPRILLPIPEFPQGALQSSTRALQMPHPSTWEGWSVRAWNVGCDKEGSHDPCTCRWGLFARSKGGGATWHTNTLMSHPLWNSRGCSLRRIGPCAEEKTTGTPGFTPFVGAWVWPTPSRGCGLACEHTSGSPTGSYLLGVPAVDCLLLPSHRRGIISVPNPDHCPDIPTTNPAQTLKPTWLLSMDWGALSKCNTL